MLRKKDLPLDITSQCYIDRYEGNFCLFYKGVPMILVNYEFWTEDISVHAGYIDYDPNEKGYTILIDVPSYDQSNKLVKMDHVYYGLFKTIGEFDEWLDTPYYLY